MRNKNRQKSVHPLYSTVYPGQPQRICVRGRSPKFIWAPCHVMCTAVLIGRDPATPPPPHPPALGLVYEGAIGQQR